jgi:hypothetical protein
MAAHSTNSGEAQLSRGTLRLLALLLLGIGKQQHHHLLKQKNRPSGRFALSHHQSSKRRTRIFVWLGLLRLLDKREHNQWLSLLIGDAVSLTNFSQDAIRRFQQKWLFSLNNGRFS